MNVFRKGTQHCRDLGSGVGTRSKLLLRLNLLLAVVLLGLAGLGVLPTGWPLDALSRPFLGFCLAGLVLVWMMTTRVPVPAGGTGSAALRAARGVDWLAVLVAVAAVAGAGLSEGEPDRLVRTAGLVLGFGLGALVIREALFVACDRSPGALAARARLHLEFVADWLVLPLFVFNGLGVAALVTLLSPVVLDPILAAVDRTLAFGLDLTLPGRSIVARALDLFHQAAPVLPLAVLGVLFRPGRREGRDHSTLLMALVLAGALCWVVNLMAPSAGPGPFGQVGASPEAAPLAAPVHRDALPALPVAWTTLALMAVFARRRRLFWWLLPVGLLSAAGGVTSGQHGLLACLLAVPLALAVWPLAGLLRRRGGKEPVRPGLDGLVLVLSPAALGIGLALLWQKQLFHPAAAWFLFAALTALTARAAVRVAGRLGPEPDAEAPVSISPGRRDREGLRLQQVLLLFFCSGLTGLVYEVVFQRELALVFGSTARATTTVLSVYMAGLAIGAFAGGRISDRVRSPLRFYALVEALVGLVCFCAPALFDLTNRIYLALVQGLRLSTALEGVVQVACCSLVVMLPALLMGTTMPLLAKQATPELSRLRRNVALLYSANTLGAAVGTLVAAYWMIAALGIDGSLRLATLVNFGVAAVAFWLAGRVSQPGPEGNGRPGAPRWGGAFGKALVVAAGLVGFVSFALEVLWIHLLSVVAGTSVYAFGLMLFSFLAGLGLGSIWIAHWRIADHLRPARLAVTIMALGICVLLLLPIWDKVPPFLGLYGRVSFADTFAQREFVRFAVCFGMMIVPTLLIGMIFPQLVDLSTRSIDALGRHVGLVSFSNTLGNILGAVVAGLVLIPLLGSFGTSLLLGAAAVLLGAVLALWSAGRWRWLLAGGGFFVTVVLLVGLPGWNLTALTMGTNVYFRYQPYGRPVEMLEGLDGGISTVARAERDGRVVTTMLTNGKFQGDDHDEMRAQSRFALYPLLHCPARGRALVIGLGTGVTAGVLRAAGFQSIDIAELSAEIADLARRYFGHVNGRVLDDPRTRLYVTDGRNLLMVRDQRYDLISMEVSSIWFAGAANLYNREFYQLARRRLRPGGVLQQWIQLHHISPADIVSILVTLRSVFDHVVLYWGGDQGVLVASMQPLELEYGYLARLEASAGMLPFRRLMKWDSFWPMIGERLLDRESIDDFVAAMADVRGVRPEELISTDRNRLLEYSTPKGNVRPHGMRETVSLLSRFHSPSGDRDLVGPDGTRDLMLGARLLGASRFDAAREHLERAADSTLPGVRTTAERLLARLRDEGVSQK